MPHRLRRRRRLPRLRLLAIKTARTSSTTRIANAVRMRREVSIGFAVVRMARIPRTSTVHSQAQMAAIPRRLKTTAPTVASALSRTTPAVPDASGVLLIVDA